MTGLVGAAAAREPLRPLGVPRAAARVAFAALDAGLSAPAIAHLRLA